MKPAVLLAAAASAAFLTACASDGPQGVDALGDPARGVPAAAETVVTTDPEVDADDPALWADASDPSRAILFGTDKSDGLYVHNLDGTVRQFFPVGQLNNVDLREGFMVDGREMVLVAATNDTLDNLGINTWLLDPRTLEVREYGHIATDIGEPYGFCMARVDQTFYLIATTKAGTVNQWPVRAGANGPEVGPMRTVNLGTQLEGCVADEQRDTLYVGEEDVGVWRFDLSPTGSPEATSVVRIDNERLKADVEGLAIMRDGGQSYLIVSSQGDSTYPVFRIEGDDHIYLGRFAVMGANGIDAVTATDGVTAWSGPIGAYPNGLLAMHDDQDDSGPGQQNYKMVDWREVRRALDF